MKIFRRKYESCFFFLNLNPVSYSHQHCNSSLGKSDSLDRSLTNKRSCSIKFLIISPFLKNFRIESFSECNFKFKSEEPVSHKWVESTCFNLIDSTIQITIAKYFKQSHFRSLISPNIPRTFQELCYRYNEFHT